jgi:hypothetical protein
MQNLHPTIAPHLLHFKNPPKTSASRRERIFTFAQESENKRPSDTIYPHNIRTQRRREYLDTQHATDRAD